MYYDHVRQVLKIDLFYTYFKTYKIILYCLHFFGEPWLILQPSEYSHWFQCSVLVYVSGLIYGQLEAYAHFCTVNSSDKHTAVVYIVCPLQLVLDHHCTEKSSIACHSVFFSHALFWFWYSIFHWTRHPFLFSVIISYCIIDYSRYFFFFLSLLPTGTASTLFGRVKLNPNFKGTKMHGRYDSDEWERWDS